MKLLFLKEEVMDFYDIRNEYMLKTLDEADVSKSPFKQMNEWMGEAISSKIYEPNVMTLATADKNGKPSARMVLLKSFDEKGFVFFTNYESKKGNQLTDNPYAALIFYWSELERQVRIEGTVEKLISAESDKYFKTRPAGSRLGAWASPQSKYIPNRTYLENLHFKFREKFRNDKIPRPDNWGGYILKANLFEFWQGRANRLHDRIEYLWEQNSWTIKRLAP
jgi:pyridoxamine 5'-phosphate oxidase